MISLCPLRLAVIVGLALPWLGLSTPARAQIVYQIPASTVTSGGTIELPVFLDLTMATEPIQGWSYTVTHDPSVLTLVDAVLGADALALNGGAGPAFFGISFQVDGFSQAVVIDLLGFDTLPPGGLYEVGLATYSIDPSFDATTSITITDGTVTVGGITVAVPGSSTWLSTSLLFLRGDCQQDAGLDLADAIELLTYVFAGGAPPECEDACDANDDGQLDVGDAVFILSGVALGGPLPPGSESCSPDLSSTADGLSCEEFAGCP